MKYLFWDNHIQLFPPVLSKNDNKWLLVDSLQNLSWELDEVSSLVLVSLFKPMTVNQWFISLSTVIKMSESDFKDLYELFILKGFVKELPIKETIFKKWSSIGCSATAHYHFLTWDSKFLDYSDSGNGREEALKIMQNYSQKQPDNQRFKVIFESKNRIQLPEINEISHQCLVDIQSSDNLLMRYAALVFGIIGTKKPPWLGDEILLKTSPSGGGRHPTEGYIIFSESKNSKIFHINVKDHTLDEINVATQIDWDKLFNIWKIPNSEVLGIFIFTSKWERNRYRYREPRTFRSVHMDVGHMLGTLSNLCSITSLSLNIILEDIDTFEKILEIDPFDETVQAVGVITNDT